MMVCCTCQVLQAQVTVSTDFTDVELQRQEMSNLWTVVNRISPRFGPGTRPELKLNLIRMIGGINKVVDGVKVPDLDFDPCTYDTNTGTYVYNWDPLIERFDNIVNSGVAIHQVVLDQPPWAFQHGYTFIPEGTMDGVNFREDERVTGYGNSLPPADKAAYHAFIQALITKLVETYGEELVMSWQFRVGSEIETPDHWKGTEQDFIDHFANTVSAVRSVLPDAKIGIHTRKPDYLYQNGTVLNYKGEVIKSFADGLIEYCHDNDVRYDFWGTSDYVIITRAKDIDMSGKYDRLFAPLVDHPKWNPDATLDIMEYKTVTTMDGADGGGTVNCVSSHRDIVELAFAQQFYQHADQGLENIFRWGNRPGSTDPIGISMLNTMNGQTRYETQVTGTSANAGNQLQAFFGKSTEDEAFDVLVYNYNGDSFDYMPEEDVVLRFTIDQPAGTVLKYRSLSYTKENNELQAFLENEPLSGWIKSDFHRYGDPGRTLNEDGAAAFSTFVHTNEAEFGSWQLIKSVERPDGKPGSMVEIDTALSSFAFKKYEFQTTVLELLAGWDTWTWQGSDGSVRDTPASYANLVSGSATQDGTFTITAGKGSSDGTWGTFAGPPPASTSTVASQSGFKSRSGTPSITFTITNTYGSPLDLSAFHFDAGGNGNNAPTTWTLAITLGDLTTGTVASAGDVNRSWNTYGQHDVWLTGLADHTLDAGGSVTFELAFSGGDGTKDFFIDNVGVSAFEVVPPVHLLAGWDTWQGAASGMDTTASYTNGVSGSATQDGTFSIQADKGSADETWGTFAGPPPASTTTGTGESGFKSRSGTPSVIFSITNTSGSALDLSAFHFDAGGNGNSAPTTWTLTVASGDLTAGTVASASDVNISWNTYSQHDVSLTGLADNTLDAGGSVTFELAFSGGDGTKDFFIDNVGVSSVAAGYPDRDKNDLPDWWEIFYFGATGQEAEVDSDGDGLTNGAELTAGTDPTDPNSRLMTNEFQMEADGFTVTWDSYSGRTYQVMKSTSLLPNDWISISGLLPGTGGEMSFTDTSPVTPKGFYKIQVNRP